MPASDINKFVILSENRSKIDAAIPPLHCHPTAAVFGVTPGGGVPQMERVIIVTLQQW